jgi:type VI secretion system protein ImpL
MSWILPLLKSKFAALGAVLVIALIIAFGGPMILGARYRLWCWLAAALIIIGYLIFLLIKKIRAKKNAKMLEGFLNQQADDQVMSARPDVQDELTAIKEKLNQAMQVLKQSKMARGRRGAEALYVLPWYMIIGPSACGKSTAIRNSGLHFPPVDPDSDDPGKVKGLGGTRNCDWWFSNEGILLDTAGRYTLSANVQEDREEWTSFLDMLRKARPRAPINGLILAISIDELLQMDADAREAHARALRSRIDELIIKLEILFPVYLVFTKCDLISGFVEFFGSMGKADREQVWGFTRKNEPSRGALGEEFEGEFDDLCEVLGRRRIPELVSQISPNQKRGIYQFPVEFGAVRSKLSSFIETLFRPNPYQQNPMVRGIYFTSGTQEGEPIAQVIAEIGRNFGIASQASQAEPVTETKAYFIRDLFQEVILPDESLVFPTTKAWRRRRWLKVLAIAGQLVVTGLLLTALFISLGNNRSASDRLGYVAEETARATQGVMNFDLDRLYDLDRLRQALDKIETHKPLMERWGLYSVDIAAAAARDLYFRRYHSMVLIPTAHSLQFALEEPFTCDETELFDAQYARFRAYRMLTLPWDSIPQTPFRLKAEMVRVWAPIVGEERDVELSSLIEPQVEYYWRHRNNPAIPGISVVPDRHLIATVNQQVNQCWSLDRLYKTLISDVNDNIHSFGYSDAQLSIYLEGSPIGGAFLRDGWEQYVRPRIDSMPDEISRDPVKKQAFERYTDDEIRDKLTEKYVADFANQWRAFIRSGHVTPFATISAAVNGTAELGQDPFPIIQVLKKVYEQSDLGGLSQDHTRRIEEEFRDLGRFLGLGANVPEGVNNVERYTELLSGLPKSLEDLQGKLESAARCGENLRNFVRDVDAYKRRVKQLSPGRGVIQDAQDLMVQPFDVVGGAAAASACNCLDQAWKNQVWNDYNNNLANLYPFNAQSDRGAARAEATNFFRDVRSFVQSEIDPAKGVIPISPKFERAMSEAQRIGQILSPGARDQVMFTLEASGLNGIRRVHFQYANNPEWVYVAGQPQRRSYVWPPAGEGRCQLWIEALGNGFYNKKEYTGDWGIFKFFDEAKRRGNRLVWEFKSQGYPTLEVQFTLGGDHASFINEGHFTQFQCPESVCH